MLGIEGIKMPHRQYISWLWFCNFWIVYLEVKLRYITLVFTQTSLPFPITALFFTMMLFICSQVPPSALRRSHQREHVSCADPSAIIEEPKDTLNSKAPEVRVCFVDYFVMSSFTAYCSCLSIFLQITTFINVKMYTTGANSDGFSLN